MNMFYSFASIVASSDNTKNTTSNFLTKRLDNTKKYDKTFAYWRVSGHCRATPTNFEADKSKTIIKLERLIKLK